jgi:hypothetical protein
MQILGKWYVIEKNLAVLDSATQKSINLAKIFKNVSENCKSVGLCYQLMHVHEKQNYFVT